jgi:hypothetical protein
MSQPAKSRRRRLADFRPNLFELTEQGRRYKSAPGRGRCISAHSSSGLQQTALVPGCDLVPAASCTAASLGVHMDGLREEGSGRAPNAAIPAAELLYYTRRGESHRPACCYPDLYAGAQGNPCGGYC